MYLVIWLGNFWYFGKLVSEERWSQAKVQVYYSFCPIWDWEKSGRNEWMYCIYILHISHIVSRRFTILTELDRTSACKGASGCRYQFLFDLTRPPNPCMKCTMKLQIDHHTGNYVPYSFWQVCGFLNIPCWPCNTEDAGDGAYGL